MTLLARILQPFATASKKREAARLRHELWEIRDWKAQANRIEREKEEALRRLEMEIDLAVSPDELVRRAGAGA